MQGKKCSVLLPEMSKVYALIAAAGAGTRMGPEGKLLLSLNGVPVLQKTAEAFLNHSQVESVLLVCPPEKTEEYKGLFAPGYAPRIHFARGGETRSQSVRAGLLALGGLGAQKEDIVLIHDGARPFVSAPLINACIAACRLNGSAVPVLPVKETIKQAANGHVFTPARAQLFAAQTPQTFLFGEILAAYKEGAEGTDDAHIYELSGKTPVLIPGEEENYKLTTPADLPRAPSLRVGMGFDVHAFAPDRALVLGGVPVPCERGLAGHSDADVLTHAIMDALLGAAALPDIGRLFPDTDNAYKDINSLLLLARVAGKLKEEGWCVVNIDAVLATQKPKVSPYVPQMREELARVLGIEKACVGVQASTTERLGFVGREEGMAAFATCLLQKG